MLTTESTKEVPVAANQMIRRKHRRRDLSYSAFTHFAPSDMIERFTSPTAVHLADVRGGSHAAPLDVHAWTGRCALSSATTTSRPHIATAGARRTRVSGMRLSVPRIERHLVVEVPLHSVSTMREPRNPGPRHALSG